ncbi:hypothetical protein NP233_g6675 [Leucocoprinus birnbaumii]|uniref:G domain-containing protein n=1 Tax=Leucocoprinus birnbaumii TaxID=56174 RepID=A0AAD5VSX9_9AGAR|nr:hypothetical protein NP233_g6675 [Leucocoprinus birnbaumii]
MKESASIYALTKKGRSLASLAETIIYQLADLTFPCSIQVGASRLWVLQVFDLDNLQSAQLKHNMETHVKNRTMEIRIKNIFPYIWSIFFGNRVEPAKSLSGITIALVGRSGSGMSQLIHDATGSYATGVAPDNWHSEHNSQTYTDSIQSHGYTIPGVEHTDFPLVFIDTPGFNSLSHNDVHTALRDLRDWLKRFKPQTKVDGLIVMHDVSIDVLHNRPTFSPRESIEKLCGSDWAQKVVFVSTHWDDFTGTDKSKNMEAQIEAYWSVMRNYPGALEPQKYEAGSSVCAWKILRPLVERALTSRKHKLNEELVSLSDKINAELYDRVCRVVLQKTRFMERLVPKLGIGRSAVILTDDERTLYNKLNLEALEIWKEVENELDIIELERFLTVGLANDSDKIRRINIAVVGSTGSGKSQFIYDVTGQRRSFIASEYNFHPHTKGFDTAHCIIQAADLSLQWDYHVTLIDTPGFDYLDPQNDEREVFTSLMNWVRKRFGGPKLDGIIFLHSVQYNELDNRNSLFHYSQSLRDLWHDEWDRRIVFVSSFWSEEYLDTNDQAMSSKDMEKRECAIRANYLNLMRFPIPMISKPYEDSPQELRVAVVGRTGSGLSQIIDGGVEFIHDVTGTYDEGVAAAAALRPFTQSITTVSAIIPGLPKEKVVLIDTPGFDLTKGNNEHDTFAKLAKWVKQTYGRRAQLDGVIYMHNIWTDELLHRPPLLTSDPLEDICGLKWREKIVFVNSHWSEDVRDDGTERETRLKEHYWSFMLSRGSAMTRYEEPKRYEKAVEILKLLLKSPR